MDIPVVVMAGGRGTRFGSGEKPMALCRGHPVIQHLLGALRTAGVDAPIVATSPWVRETTRFSESMGLIVLQTPGKGYAEDIGWISRKLPGFVCVAGDIPFPPVAELTRFLDAAGRSSTSIVGLLPERLRFSQITPGPRWPHEVPPFGPCRIVGVNRVDVLDPDDKETFVFRDPWIGAAVTTPADLEWIAENAP